MIWYKLGLLFYRLAVSIASLFQEKAKLLRSGQKKTLKKLSQTSPFSSSDQIIWVHVASLGEFEQARPIIEKIKVDYPHKKVLLSFFSPSGYEIRKNYALADEVVYLPFDRPSHAHQFIEFYQPELAIIVKYEFWYYYFKRCQELKIPLLSVSTILRPDHIFFKKKNEYTNVLGFVKHFFVQNKETQTLLNSKNYANTTISGDTRFDRVIKLREEVYDIKDIEAFCEGKKTLVIGSLWKEDLAVLKEFITQNTDYRYIIAPHEIDDQTVSFIENELNGLTCRYTKSINQEVPVLIVDTIGLLMGIYSMADVAYVGGAFSKGLHNILEPATFGLPVIFGPKYSKFAEAVELIKLKGAFSISNKEETVEVLTLLLEKEGARINASEISRNYVTENAGATEKIMSYIKEELTI